MSWGVGSKMKTASPSWEAAPGREDRVGVGEHDEEASGREVRLIAFPRENASKVGPKAEERSQHTTTSILILRVHPEMKNKKHRPARMYIHTG